MAEGFQWDDIRVFLAASRAETLTEAARSLKVSQPTVGRRLKALEGKLGTALFQRAADSLTLTEAGRALLPFAHEMERQTYDLTRALDGLAEPRGRALRVTAIGSVALFLLRSFAEIEAACAPQAIELISTGERLNLAREEADIALRMNQVPTRGELVCRKIGRIAYALYANPALADQLDLDGEKALPTARFVGYRKNPRRKSQSSWLYNFGQAGSFPLRVNELHLRFEAARRGFGVTILPCHLGDSCGDLVRVQPPIEALTEEIYLLMHESRRSQPAVRQLAEILTMAIENGQAELLGEAEVGV